MAKAENKTKPTAVKPKDFIAAVEHETRRADAKVLDEMLGRLTGYKPKMWGPSIICLLYTSPSPRDQRGSRMPSSA